MFVQPRMTPSPINMLLSLGIIVYTMHTTTGFILDRDNCIVSIPPACHCEWKNNVHCEGKHFMDIPDFGTTDLTDYIHEFTINFNDNQITSIQAYSFKNISSVNTSFLSLSLSNNHIGSIDIYAFLGIETKLAELFLDNNSLSSLPTALITLTRLENLHVEANPLLSLDPYVLTHIGKSLKVFSFEMGNFQTWPYDLNKLSFLEKLKLFSVQFRQLPIDAFNGIEQTLFQLTVSSSRIEGVSSSLCQLSNLQMLTFENNFALRRPFFNECTNAFPNFFSLSLNNNNLQQFPDGLHLFPSLGQLFLNNNSIRFINTHDVPDNLPLATLYLRDNQLTRIPFALNRFHQLLSLYMEGNQVTTIEDHDLIGLQQLVAFYLGGQVEYISENAFQNNKMIRAFSVNSSILYDIPRAVTHLPDLQFLKLGSSIDCNCDLSYLKGWNVTAITYIDKCAVDQNMTIVQYITKSLPKCP